MSEEFPVNWGDELDELVAAVHRIFGHEVLQEALSGALTATSRQAVPVTDDSPLADARIIPAAVFEGLLKTELRRLVRPQCSKRIY